MKSIINRNRNNNNINKINNRQRISAINKESYNLINNILNIKDNLSIYKTNKTIQKYINQKLSSLKSLPKTIKNESMRTKSKIRIRNPSNKTLSKKKKINIKVYNKVKKGRNNNQEFLLKEEYKTNKIYSSYNDLPNLIKNKKINNNINLNNNNNLIKSPMQTKGKLVSNIYQNYSSSISTGLSIKNNNELYKSCSNFLDDNSSFKCNNSIDSKNENQKDDFFPYFNTNFKINYNEDRSNNTTNNYEIDSSEDNMINNKITFKFGNGSPITFGNSFSYTNSKRSSSNRMIIKNNGNDNIEIIDKKDDDNVFLLKNQNETLKKELKESNEQINILKKEIQKLIKNKNNNKKYKNQKQSIIIKNKNNSKSNSCLKKTNINYHKYEIRIKRKNISNRKKIK